MNESTPALGVRVRFFEGRYHGEPEWPPAPARLFQALVAGAGRGSSVPTAESGALEWLERLPPPWVGAPAAKRGQRVTHFVPHNDLDAVGGDPGRVGEVRVSKLSHPRLFDPEIPVIYLWHLRPEDRPQAQLLGDLALDLHQLGRGVDLAWAEAEWLEPEAVDALVASYSGAWRRPCAGVGGEDLPCPRPGTLASLEQRHRRTLERFVRGSGSHTLFRQPPKASFQPVPYESRPTRLLFELRSSSEGVSAGARRLAARALTSASRFAEEVRDALAARLHAALPPALRPEVERAVMGRTPEGWSRLTSTARVRLIPLPSIGHEHTDPAIRRLLVEVPGDCPLASGDLEWGLSGLSLVDAMLTRAPDRGMLRHYGVEPWPATRGTQRRFQTVTPVALPEGRRRLAPDRPASEHKGAPERLREEAGARAAIGQALRHAGVLARPISIRVQREPFAHKGERAEAFAPETRFAKERLWHVELEFAVDLPGPLVLGDGRFLGLGLLAPVRDRSDEVRPLELEVVEGWSEAAEAEAVAKVFRRACLARAQEVVGPGTELPEEITGHAQGGDPSQGHPHAHYACDPVTRRLLVFPGSFLEGKPPSRSERRAFEILRAACVELRDLRAGSSGRFRVRLVPLGERAFARVWESRTPYAVRRHAKRSSAREVLERDVREACGGRGLPLPHVEVLSQTPLKGLGLTGHLRLVFPVPVQGPLVLGKTRHKGGGLFGPCDDG